MIDISKLTESDKSREVRYSRPFCCIEFGKITSWNDKYIFVNYHTMMGAVGPTVINVGDTSAATDPKDLTFTSGYRTTELEEGT